MVDVVERLMALRDVGYRDFHSRLMPTVDRDRVIGVRVPVLRRLAKELAGVEGIEDFLDGLPHHYYEENNLHAFLIEGMKDYDEAMARVEAFLPYVDNWATCDMMSPKCVRGHWDDLAMRIEGWLDSGRVYTIRFGIDMLMRYYLEDERFERGQMVRVVGVDSEKYYISMGVAWYVATALAKQREAALEVLRGHRLRWATHNRAIQKGVESYRIDDELKAVLRGMRVRREADYVRKN